VGGSAQVLGKMPELFPHFTKIAWRGRWCVGALPHCLMRADVGECTGEVALRARWPNASGYGRVMG